MSIRWPLFFFRVALRALFLPVLVLTVGALTSAQTIGITNEYPVPTINSMPLGITLGPDGALWFTEGYGSKIGRITTAGAISEYLLPTSPAEPSGITAGPDRALWFTGRRRQYWPDHGGRRDQ